jgi:tetratricopeptide (TPR) repeat protein
VSRVRFRIPRAAAGLLILVLAMGGAAQSPASTLSEAHAALQTGQADQVLNLLAGLPAAARTDAQARNLACRVEFILGRWDAAVNDCQLAVRLDPGNSEFHMWLGRAYGEKADRASFLTAFSLGKRVLIEFQTATRLDPRNGEALSDLGEFYVEAPGIVGGGLDKAESVAKELDRVEPARAAELRARIAEKRNDFGTAELQFKKAIAVSPHPALQWATLARFYQLRKRFAEMDAAIRNCMSAAERDPYGSGVGLYDAAGVLIAAGRDPGVAARLLQDYVNGASQSEEAPVFVAYYRLAYLQKKMGDPAGAEQSQAVAYRLAPQYNPAQDLRH